MSTDHQTAMRIYRSNRAERLLDALSELLETPAGGPLAPEYLVVESRAMAVWVSMQLAQRQGVWTNCRVFYPRQFIRYLMATLLGEIAEEHDAFARETLVWAILATLPEYLEQQEFERLRGYLAGDAVLIKRFQLAQRIAETFDGYLIYRPEMLLQWEEGADGQVHD